MCRPNSTLWFFNDCVLELWKTVSGGSCASVQPDAHAEVKPEWTLRQCGRAEPWWVDPAHWIWTLLRLSFTQRFAWCGLTGTQVHGRPGRWLWWVVQISSCSRGQEVDSHVAFARATPLIPSPKWRSCFPLSLEGFSFSAEALNWHLSGQRRMKCHAATAADNRSGGPPRPEGIFSPAAAFLRSLEPSVNFDKKF